MEAGPGGSLPTSQMVSDGQASPVGMIAAQPRAPSRRGLVRAVWPVHRPQPDQRWDVCLGSSGRAQRLRGPGHVASTSTAWQVIDSMDNQLRAALSTARAATRRRARQTGRPVPAASTRRILGADRIIRVPKACSAVGVWSRGFTFEDV
jgi:hypothetical protein